MRWSACRLERVQKASVDQTGTNFQVAYHRPVGPRNATARGVVRSGSLTYGSLLPTADSQARGDVLPIEMCQNWPGIAGFRSENRLIAPVPRAWILEERLSRDGR